MDGSLSGSINGMDITPEGVHFVTGESGEKKRKPSPAYLNGAMDPAGGRLLEISTAGSKGHVVRFRSRSGWERKRHKSHFIERKLLRP